MALLIRLLLLAALGWFIYRTVRRWLDSKAVPPPAPPGDPQTMQRCAHCGMHLPPGECTHSQGRVFCSESHRDAWQRDPR